MKYPEWAPTILVKQHMNGLDNSSPNKKFKIANPDERVTEFAQEEGVTEEALEIYRQYLYRRLAGLPDEESTALLGKLITDPRMKDAWKSLARRVDKDLEFFNFFRACECGINGWRGDLKQTAAERKAFYQEICDTVGKLQYLMYKSGKFDLYYTSELIDDQRIESLMDALYIPEEFSYTQFCISNILPSIHDVLTDISDKAMKYGKEEPSVKKPNSENADIHYFVRTLSQYLKNKYKQPLHEVVAATTAVTFDRLNIDSDYVRKLVG